MSSPTKERIKELEEGGITPDQLGPGDLNFLLTSLLVMYTQFHDKNYDTINAVLGAMDAAKAEYQRRMLFMYNNMKIPENGDVYEPLFPKPLIARPDIVIAK